MVISDGSDGSPRWQRSTNLDADYVERDNDYGDAAMGAQTRVDVLSLEDFHQRLAARLAEAELVLSKLNTEMQCRPPALGSFVDATSNAQQYTKLHQGYVDRIERLRQAVTAAQEATQRILDNYRTTEARNKANAADIARALGGVDDPLKLEEPRDV
jgi:hypothetical protein